MTESSGNYRVARKSPVKQNKELKKQSGQMKAGKKEMLEMQHPQLASVFDQRNTKKSLNLMEIRSKDIENDSDWCVCGAFIWIMCPPE